jgi:hypothetical protein
MALGPRLLKVYIANARAGKDQQARAKPNHSKISPAAENMIDQEQRQLNFGIYHP